MVGKESMGLFLVRLYYLFFQFKSHTGIYTAATGSDYFSMCHSLHIPTSESDLILIELSINDEYLPEHAENMEHLLRGLLESAHHPAVMLVQPLGLGANSMATGGDVHLPVATFYDVPVIS